MLQFENVQKYYGSFLAMNIPALSIDKGVWWLQGENGSGKTTVLKMIAGLHPFNGNILLDNLYNLKKQRQEFVRRVNYAEAEPLYPPFLTAKDLIELYCYTKGGNINEAANLLKQLNVFDSYQKPLATYSSGMIKKVSLTLAFIGKPALILLDEPLITIDTKAVDLICMLIKSKQDEGISFIITSHQTLQTDQLIFTGTLLAENKTLSRA